MKMTLLAPKSPKSGFLRKHHYSVWVGRHGRQIVSRPNVDMWSLDSYSGALKAPRASDKQYILHLGHIILAFQRVLLIGWEAAVGVVTCRVSPPPKDARRPP